MADTKVTALTENTTPAGTDLLYIVDDPGGSALSQKITVTNLLSLAPAVTLAADADTILNLSTQELGLDTQTANYVLAGPTSGAAADPTFRAAVVADMPTAIRTRTINFIIDGGGDEIADGIKGDIVVDFACTITAWTLLADQSGAIKIDLWKDTYANFPPTDDDSICNGHEPEIAASGTKAQDIDIADWSGEAITAGDIIRVNVDSCTTCQRVTLALTILV